MTTTIWHNPRCSKSRQTLALLTEHGIEPHERRYLEDTPTAAELTTVIQQLGMTPWALLRRGESVFKESGLSERSSDRDIVAAMIEHPVLIERPIVVHGGRAALGRPPEHVLSLLD